MDYISNIKLVIKYLSVVLLVSFGVITVFSTDLIFDPQIENFQVLSKNIFLDNSKLNTNYIVYKSNIDLSNYTLNGTCNLKTKFIGSISSKYMFKIKYLDTKCYNGILFLETKEKKQLKKSFIGLKIFNKSKLFDLYVDNNDLTLKKLNNKLSNNIKLLDKNIKNIEKKDFRYLIQKRRLEEFKYHKRFLNKILELRNLKYSSPVFGYEVSKEKNEIPNAGRPYRNKYTDGIHHGWDIVAPNKTKVVALDYGKIVRIIYGFKFSDLSKIKKHGNITNKDKINNLNILRGNQVWLKTSKGDVVFYSHLSKISKDLKVGDIVSKGEYLGNIGITGVPDKNYKNYHLHFSIMKNPYKKNKVGKYTFMDYMKWDWYFKGKSLEYVVNNENNIFK